MSIVDPSEVEIRILGSLIEKQKTTPDHYPLTLNALRSACNQTTNRDPVVSYDEATLRDGVERLVRRRWIRSASGHGGRVPKYRHLLEDELGLTSEQLSVLAVLMLRGPQTPGELKQRAERMHELPSLDDVHRVLEELIERDLAERLPRAPGQKEERYRQLLGGEAGAEVGGEPAGAPERAGLERSAPEGSAHAGEPGAAVGPGAGSNVGHPIDERLLRLESELAGLKREIAELRARLEDDAG